MYLYLDIHLQLTGLPSSNRNDGIMVKLNVLTVFFCEKKNLPNNYANEMIYKSFFFY
jgi:hypothetical protein